MSSISRRSGIVWFFGGLAPRVRAAIAVRRPGVTNRQSPSFAHRAIAGFLFITLALPVVSQAATFTWDANGATTGVTDGAGAWLDANQWWDGTSNVAWTSGDDAMFGVGGTGGAVTLSSTTAAGSLTFNPFSGTYTIGTAGQTLTLGSGGLTMNAGAGAVTLASPVTLSVPQSWTNNSSSLLTASGAIMNGGNLLTVAGSGSTTLSAAISGAGGLTKNGSGVLVVSASNTYTGAVTVNAGTLRLGATGALGATSGTTTVNAGATLDINGVGLGSETVVLAGGTFVNRGADQQNAVLGALVVSANSTIGGSNRWDVRNSGASVTVNAGVRLTKVDENTVYLAATGNPVITNNGEIVIDGGTVILWSGILKGNGSFTVNNGKTLEIKGMANPLSVTLNNGILKMNGPPTTTQSGSLTIVASTTNTLQSGQVNQSTSGVVLSGNLFGGGRLNIVQAGGTATTLSGDNSGFTGTLGISNTSGSILFASANAASGSAAYVFFSGTNGGANAAANTVTGSVTHRLGSLSGTAGRLDNFTAGSSVTYVIGGLNSSTSYGGLILNTSGTTAVTKEGTGALTLSGVNTYTGATTIASGTIITGTANAISANSAITIGSGGSRGFLDIDHDLTISSLTFTGLGGDIVNGSSGTATFSAASGTATIKVSGGTNAFHANATLGTATVVDVDAGASFSFHNNLFGSASLTKSGAGTLELVGDNDLYAGNFIVTGGRVNVGAGMNQIGTGTTTLSGGATIDLGGQAFTDRIVVLDGTILNAGGTATTATIEGPTTLSGTTTLLGTYTITSTGSARFNAAVGDGSAIVNVNVNSGAGNGGQAVFEKAVAGLANVTVYNGGTATFNDTVSGYVISHGVSTFNASVLSSEVQVKTGGSATFAATGTAATATVDAGGSAVFGGTVAGLTTVSGSARFTSASSLTGELTTGAGATATLDEVSATITGAIHNDGTLAVSRSTGSQTIASAIGGTGSLVKQGAGLLVVTGTNAYSGGTVIAGGTIRAGSVSALGASSGALTLNAGSLDLYGKEITVGMLSGSAGSAISSGIAGAARLVASSSSDSTFAGVISNGVGTVGFTKSGAGRLTLAGVSAYTGSTIIAGGTLALSGDAALAHSVYIKAGNVAGGGGVLDVTGLTGGLLAVANGQKLGGYGTVYGDVTIANGALVAPGGSIGSLAIDGDTTWGGGGSYLFEVYDAGGSFGTGWDLLEISGGLTITSDSLNPFIIDLQTLTTASGTAPGAMPGGNWDPNVSYAWKFAQAGSTISTFDPNKFTFVATNFQNEYGGSFSIARGDTVTGGTDSQLYIVYAAVPEPGTFALAGIGIVSAAWALARKRRQAS